MSKSHRELVDALESLVDETSLTAVLECLTEIAGGKSDHVLANWQDDVTAKTWRRAETIIGKAAAAVDELAI